VAGNDHTKTTLDKYLPEVWSRLISVAYEAMVVIEPLMDHSWQPELPVGAGDLVNVPKFTESTSADKRSTFGTGAALTYTAVTEGQLQIPVNQMAYKAYRFPVEMSLQAMSKYVPLLIKDVSTGISAQIDTELAADDTSGFDAFTEIGTDNEQITEETLFEAEAVLVSNNMLLQDRFAVWSANSRADLLQIEVLRNQLNTSVVGSVKGNTSQGFFGHTLTWDNYVCNNLEAGSNGTKNFMGQHEAIAFIAQNDVTVKQQTDLDAGLFDIIAGWKAYGFLLMKANAGRQVNAR